MSNISAAPVLCELNGINYTMSPITNKDTDELNNYIKKKHLHVARTFCQEVEDAKIIEATMSAAMKQTLSFDWLLNPELLDNINNISYLLWMGARSNPPHPNFNEFKEALAENWDINFGKALDALKLVNPTLLGKVTKKDLQPME